MGSDEKPGAGAPTGPSKSEHGSEKSHVGDSRQKAEEGDTALAASVVDGVAALSEQAWVGRVVDERYRVVGLIGRGGMGAVFEAEHLKLKKRVAFKVVRAELAGNGEVAARFAREAMATAQFEHPHVASALDFGTLPEGGAYFVMQLVRGKSLAELLEQDQRLAWPRVCELAAQVSDALSAAQSAGIVHRDLKPENILVEARDDGSELARILDFGIARVPQSEATSVEGSLPTRALTRLGTIIGTPGYMAPEQALGGTVDHRADVYALGVVIWECIVGRALWDAPDLTTLLARQIGESAPSLKQAATAQAVPAQLDELVARMLDRKPEQRPGSAAEVRDALRAIAREGNGSNKRTGSVGSLPQWVRDRVAKWRNQPLYERRLQVTGVITLGAVTALAIFALAAGDPKVPRAAVFKNILSGQAEVKQPERTIPEEIEEAADTMLHATRRSDRRAAAKKVLEYQPAERVVQYILDIAALENARGCQDLKKAIGDLGGKPDLRTLPTLHRLSDAPKTGCGFLGLEDCYSCARKVLREAIIAIADPTDK
jgi:eukaryotic-like serine/threonine-protein kinase